MHGSEPAASNEKFELIDFDPLDLIAGFFATLLDTDPLQQAEPREPHAPEPKPAGSYDLAEIEKRIIAAVSRKPDRKPETQSPFLRQKDAIKLLGCRSVLEACEKAGWLTATIRRARLVQYKRQDVLNCAYRLSQGEYP